MKNSKSLLKIYTAAAAALVLVFSADAGAAVTVSGDVTAKNQTGTHEGEVYRNYLKADLNLNETFENTEVKAVLRAEEDSLRPDEDDENYVYYMRDDKGPRRVYLREAYISHDIYFDSLIDSINIKMGRIIYTWGNSDEVKPVDILNPQDYSNLYFTPVQDRKYGVFSGAFSVFFTENFFIEAVAIPEFKPSEIASSAFVTGDMKMIGAMDSQVETVMPEHKIKNSSAAGRIGLTLFDIDMHAGYFYGYDRLPVYELKVTNPMPLETDITAVYKKIQMFGFDFQRALLMGISIRGEAAYFERGKYFAWSSDGASVLTSPLAADLVTGGNGSVEKKYIEYTIGFDDQDFILDDIYLNLQFHQKIIAGYESGLSSDRYRNLVLWNVKYYIDSKKYRISSQGAFDTGDRSVYANAEFMVKLSDNFEFAVGSWFLEGDEDTDIGQFEHRDIAYVSGKLTF